MSAATTTSTSSRPGLARPLLTTVAVTVGTNLAIYLAGWLADVDFTVIQGDTVRHVNAILVVVMSVAPLLLGGLALALTRRWSPTSWRLLAWVGLVIGVVSMPLFLDATAGTKLTLSPMHLVAGIAWFVLVTRELQASKA